MKYDILQSKSFTAKPISNQAESRQKLPLETFLNDKFHETVAIPSIIIIQSKVEGKIPPAQKVSGVTDNFPRFPPMSLQNSRYF